MSMLVRDQSLESHTNPLSILVCLFALIASSCNSKAQSIAQYYHASWTTRDGAPSNMWTIVQASDGFLWIASDSGLSRFDGVTFQKFQAAEGAQISAGPLQTIFAPATGGLWISYQFGGADFITDGQVTKYGVKEGLPSGTILRFVQDLDGRLWAATSHGLVTLQGGTWSPVGLDVCPFTYTIGLAMTSSGDLYVSDGKSIRVKRRGEGHFAQTNIPGDGVALATDSTGRVWLDGDDLRQVIRSSDGRLSVQSSGLGIPVEVPLIAKDGSLWFSTSGLGIRRIAAPLPAAGKPIPPSRVQSFDEARGLSGDYAGRMLQDREGSIWVITTKGLDQFRPTSFVPQPLPSGAIGVSMVDSPSGMFAGTLRDGVHAVPMMHIGTNSVSILPGSPTPVTCLYKDEQGNVWVAGSGKLWKMVHGKFLPFELPQNLIQNAAAAVQAVSVDHDGHVWVSVIRQPVESYDGKAWRKYDGLKETAVSLYSDNAGRTWLGFVANKLAVVSKGVVSRFGTGDGIDVGNVIVIKEHGDHLWLGGTTGVEYFLDGTFHHLRVANAELTGVSGLVETDAGDLWLNQASGVARISAPDIRAALADPDYRVPVKLYDYLDGVQGIPATLRPIPTLVQASNGLLYFSSLTGLVALDPGRIPHNDIVPTVVVDSVIADGRRFAPNAKLRLTSGLQTLEITYSASSLMIPKKVRFRYKLDGYDKAWQEADTRRQAFYPRLPPGNYTFHVIACNNDEVWSAVGATVQFYVPPTFLESRWFTILWLAGLCSSLCLLYLYRMRQATSRLRLQLHERSNERERIARDLHDTFFQSIQGLILRFDVAASQLDRLHPTRQMLESTLKASDRVMTEGRELVLDIRTSSIDTKELRQAFASAGVEFQDFYPSRFEINVTGRTKRLQLESSEEIYRLGREALSNAFRHARADSITVDLDFGQESLRICVRDNGVGIDPQFVAEGRRAGHWGLPGMKERARKIGGTLNLHSAPHGGTHVELKVPASRAYQTFWSSFHRGFRPRVRYRERTPGQLTD